MQDVARAAWNVTYRDLYPPDYIEEFVTRNYAPSALAELIPEDSTKRIHFEVALAEGAIVGFCHLGAGAEGMELFRIYLHPRFIGCRKGTALLQRAESFVRASGITSYHCFVHRDNALGQRFYERQGFVNHGVLLAGRSGASPVAKRPR